MSMLTLTYNLPFKNLCIFSLFLWKIYKLTKVSILYVFFHICLNVLIKNIFHIFLLQYFTFQFKLIKNLITKIFLSLCKQLGRDGKMLNSE